MRYFMISEICAKMYCKDDISKIENYQEAVNDKENKWVVHHRLETTLDGKFANEKKDLIRMNMYYNRPYFELIFLTTREHRQIHNKIRRTNGLKGKKWTTEEIENRAKAHRGIKHYNFPKHWALNDKGKRVYHNK